MERCSRKNFLFYDGYGLCYAVWIKHYAIFIEHFITQKKTTTICHGQIEYDIKFNFIRIILYRTLTASGETAISEKGVGMFLPIFSIVFLVLANKAIKKDEDLVKSVDRLR